MDEIVKFLNEQWDRREADADEFHHQRCETVYPDPDRPFPCTCGEPVAIRTDIASKRKLLELALGEASDEWNGAHHAAKQLLHWLASPFAGQPGYRQEWAA